MASKYRQVNPDHKTIEMNVPASTVVEVGDLVWDNAGVAYPASSQPDQGSEEANQAYFAARFLGVSNTQRLAAQASVGPACIIQDGVFEFPCPATNWEFGDFVGASENSGGDGLEDQRVERVTDASRAIGVCLENTASGAEKVKVRLIGKGARPAGPFGGISSAGAFSAGSDAVDRVTIKGIYMTPANVSVAVPTIANSEQDSVAVDVSSALSIQPAVGDAVVAIPMEALPTDCLLHGAYVTATDQITVTFGAKEGGAGVTGANRNFKFLVLDLT